MNIGELRGFGLLRFFYNIPINAIYNIVCVALSTYFNNPALLHNMMAMP